MMKRKKSSVQIVEVGLRDGLQNEKNLISIEDRIELAKRLILAGATRLELGAFVRSDRVPQMQGSAQVCQEILAWAKAEGHSWKGFSALVPNKKGFEECEHLGLPEIAIFGAASETFSQKNINCSIEESFVRFAEVIRLAKKKKIRVRGYLSTCFGCPYEGPVDEKRVVALAKRMMAMGCFEVSIGDTIGVATPGQIQSVFKKLKKSIPVAKLAGHFHDTRGTALANILAAYQLGVRVFDSSLGGLGGCPYAPGAAGNVATEDVVYLFRGMGVETGLDLQSLIEANHDFSRTMKKELPSKMAQAGLANGL